MEQKGIDFGGQSNFPDDYASKDGTLRLATNVINENGTIEPLPHPVEAFIIINDGMPLGAYDKDADEKQYVRAARLLFIHRGSTYTHYIVEYELVGYTIDSDASTLTVDASRYSRRIAWYDSSDIENPATGTFAGHNVLDLGITKADGTNRKGYNGSIDWNRYTDTDQSADSAQSRRWQADFVSQNYFEQSRSLNSRELSFEGEPAKNVSVKLSTDGFTDTETAAGAVARITVTLGQVPNIDGIKKYFNIATTGLKHNISSAFDNTETGQYNGYRIDLNTGSTDTRQTDGTYTFLITKDNIALPDDAKEGETLETPVVLTTQAWYDRATYDTDLYTFAPSAVATTNIRLTTTVGADGTPSGSDVSDDTKNDNTSGSTTGGGNTSGSETTDGGSGSATTGDGGTEKTSFRLNNVLLTDFDYNDLTAMGNMLVFTTDNYLQYCLWKDQAYILFTNNDLRYNVRLKPTADTAFTGIYAYPKEVLGSLVFLGAPVTIADNLNFGWSEWDKTSESDDTTDDDTTNIRTQMNALYEADARASGLLSPDNNYYTPAEVQNIISALDGYVTAYIRDTADDYRYCFKHFNFGIAALRLYDGSYVAFSDIFLLSPRVPMDHFRFNTKGKAGNSKIRYYGSYYEVKAEVSGVSDVIKNVIQGVDFFFSSPQTLIDNQSKLKISDLHFYGKNAADGTPDVDGSSEQATGNFVHIVSSNDLELDATLHFHIATDDVLKDIIDALAFHHTTFIDKDDFARDGNASWQRLMACNDSQGELLDMADYTRGTIGAKKAYTYSGRVNLAGVRRIENDALALRPTMYCYRERKMQPGTTYTESLGPSWYLTLIDADYTLGDGLIATSKSAEMILTVTDRDTTGAEVLKRYYRNDVEYPLNPFISYPSRSVTKMDVKIKVDGKYYGMTVRPVNSSTLNLSYYLFLSADRTVSDRSLNLVPIQKITVLDTTTYTNATLNLHSQQDALCALQPLSSMTDALWQQEKDAALGYVQEFRLNQIYQSEIQNPMFYPTKYAFTVGDGTIRALASNTTALSEGQFGAHPMYVFTTDGIWAVSPGSDGVWQAVQPLSRDVILPDGGSLTQLDDSLVFTTSKGLMILKGATVTGLTDALEGRLHSATFSQLGNILTLCGLENINLADARRYADGARIAFDHRHSRLYFYNTDFNYIYVYSFKSRLWTTLAATWHYTVNNYPDTLVGTTDGHLYTLAEEPAADATATVLLLTRPLKLDTPDIYKRISEWALRGRIGTTSAGISVLYGSNDMINWNVISATADFVLTAYSGTPYKFFAFLFAGTLTVGQTLAGAIFKTDYNLTARLR